MPFRMSHQPDKIFAGTQVASLVEMRARTTPSVTLRDARVPVRVEAHGERLLAVKRGVCNALSARRNRGDAWQDLGRPLPWAEVDAWRKGTAPRLRTRPGRNQTARTPRLPRGESLSHQSAAGNGKTQPALNPT